MSFAHLHVHTEYSLLDGMSRIQDLVTYTAELGMDSLAITDHGAMYGVIDFYRACKAANIKPIIGVETYLSARGMTDRDPKLDSQSYHLLLIASNQTGYRNLLKIASASQLEGFYYRPRIDRDFLAAHAEGLICTTGCLAAEIPQMMIDGREKEARRLLGWYQDTFGPERFYVELQEHEIPELHKLNRALLELSPYAQVPLLATNDVHYVRREDANPHDVLLCIGTGSLVTQSKRMRFSGDSFYLRSPQEMSTLFAEVPEAVANTVKVAQMCDVNLDSTGYHLPQFPTPEGYDAQSYLRHLCIEGLQKRYDGQSDSAAVQERFEHELALIHQMGFDNYFLIVWDLCSFARQRDIWWNVRGSGAGSLVAYVLGITNIDPLENGLIFERFLNPGRVSMPDIDLDYPDDRRAEMIDYCVQRYGEDKVAQIITFGTLGARAALRDVGRTLDIPLNEVDQLARLIPAIPGKPVSIAQALEEVPELATAYNDKERPYIRQLVDTAAQLEGIARHASTHAAGVLIADRPLVEYTPLHRPTKGGEGGNGESLGVVSQWPMAIVESIGLLKVDFLGLATLTIMRKACELIERYHGVHYDLTNIPYRHRPDDPEYNAQLDKAFELIARGDTSGVFQVEGSGMTKMLIEMKPSRFEHIIAAISLFRPGPIEYIGTYVRRMHEEEQVAYHHPLLEPILSETYGICVSGDALVMDAETGQRYRLEELGGVANFSIQGVDDNWRPAVGRVTHWIDSGTKPVYRVTLRSGADIKITIDHRLLTETGWRPLCDLQAGDHVATPPYLIGPGELAYSPIDRRRLRVLAYLIADGSLSSMASADFTSKDPGLLQEYLECLGAFEGVAPRMLQQIHGVTRVGAVKDGIFDAHYHAPNALLSWLRELGLKAHPGNRPGGLRSHEKFVPEFVFELGSSDIAFFLASLWDCDGYMGRKLCHYKTISPLLARDVQTLLLRLGISSTIYTAEYETVSHDGLIARRCGHQVTVYDTCQLAEWLQPHMMSAKAKVICTAQAMPTITRSLFLDEVTATTALSQRALMTRYGISRQHFLPRGRQRERIATRIVAPLSEALDLPLTRRRLGPNWEEIVSIEPAGEEHVYDLTVEGLHSFVANNVVVHNCVYQEQIMQIASSLFGYELGDADLMRRAVSKKKEKDLKKHRAIFQKRGPERGVSAEAAGKIFDDIEFFARYGFNKSHAADYAVLTVQTAFLKAHYPHEYMAALLTIERNNIDKVGAYIAECRRLGISVLPPQVNFSDHDFTIQPQADGAQAIRYGLCAIKNVGEGSVEAVLEVRNQGAFKDIADFCHRADLRVVGKRALESLIKVGALDEFAPRPRLLASLDRMMSVSNNLHRAADVGQMSLFGASTGIDLDTDANSVLVTEGIADISNREMLQWERDLVGVYVSEHPLQQLIDKIGQVVSAYSNQLTEADHDRQVSMAGMVTYVRRHVTKNGKPMAFAGLEDLYGQIEVVIWPSTWDETQDLWQPNRMLLLGGKIDAQRGEPKLLCDSATTNFDVFEAVAPAPAAKKPSDVPPPIDWSAGYDFVTPPDMPDYEGPEYPPDAVYDQAIPPGVTDKVPDNGASAETETSAVAVMEEPGMETVGELPAVEPVIEKEAAEPVVEEEAVEPRITDRPMCLRVHVKRCGNAERDKRILQRVHGALISSPGQDSFSLVIVDGNREIEFDFPNETTHYSAELVGKIRRIVGYNAIQMLESRSG